mgnify:FL=1
MELGHIYLELFVFIILGVVFVLAPFVVSFFMAPSKPSEQKLSTYECGEIPVGFAWVQYNVRYYFFVLIFLVFDVETIFLFPWAVIIKEVGVVAMVEMLIFLTVLFFGLIYAWRKGALEWL